MSENFDITLWGPSNSGKTWFLNAFRQRISLLHRHLNKDGYSFELRYQQDNSLAMRLAPELEIKPTEKVSITPYLFQRTYKPPNGDLIQSQVNSHVHRVTLIDDAGNSLLDLVPKTNPEELNQATEIAQEILSKAHAVILLLDQGTLASAKDLFLHLSKLQELINNGQSRYIAACAAKTDELGKGLEALDARALIRGKFGANDGKRIIKVLEDFRTDGHKVNFFAVSAMGYIKQNGNFVTNMDPDDSKKLMNRSEWEPIKVEEPFFWIFDEIERARLSNSLNHASKSLLPLGGLKTWQQTRMQAYVSYAELLKLEQQVRRGK